MAYAQLECVFFQFGFQFEINFSLCSIHEDLFQQKNMREERGGGG